MVYVTAAQLEEIYDMLNISKDNRTSEGISIELLPKVNHNLKCKDPFEIFDRVLGVYRRP